MNSACRWLLIWSYLKNGMVATTFQRWSTVLNYFGQIGHWNEIPALGAQDRRYLATFDYGFCSYLTQLLNAHSYT
jgi:hypothetical protein